MVHRAVLLVFVAVLLLTAVAVDARTAEDEPARVRVGRRAVEGECNLRCWLRAMEVDVPALSFPVLKGTFNVTDLTLWGMEVGHMNGDWYPDPAAATSDAVLLSAAGVTLNISAAWSFSLTKSARPLSGTLATQVVHSSMDLALQFGKDAQGLIDRVTSPKCRTDLALGDIRFTGDMQWILDHAVKLLKTTLLHAVDRVACQQLPALIANSSGTLFAQANDLIREYWNSTEPRVVPVPPDAIDVRTSPVFNTVDYALNRLVGVRGPLNLTYLVGIFSNGTGTVSMRQFTNATPALTVPLPDLNATITLGLTDAVVSHLDTWNDFRVLNPVSAHVLRSFTDLADLGINVSFFVNVSVNGDMIRDPAYLYEEASLVTYMSSNTLTVLLQAAPRRHTFDTYSDTMCLTPACLVAALGANGTALIDVALNMTFDYIKMLAAGEELEADVRKVANTLFAVLIDNYKFIIPSFVDGLLSGPGLTFINDALNQTIRNASCPYQPDEPYSDINVTVTLAVMAAAVVVSLLIATFPLYEHYHGFKSVGRDGESEERKALLGDYEEGGMKKAGFWANFRRTDPEGASLFMDKRLNVFVRAFVPLLLFVNAAMFISSNTGTGASVFIYLTFADERVIRLPSMFDFGLVNSVVDMWKAGVYPLSILVAVFSGVWPYTKLIMMLFVWLLPVSAMSKSRRESWLLALDVLGKWSLLDSYIMIMMLVAFHVHIEFPAVQTAYLAKPTVLDVYVYPAYGFLMLMVSTITSLFLSHLMMALHRSLAKTTTTGDGAAIDDNATPEARRKRSLFLYLKPKHCAVFTRVLITLLLFATALLFFAGSSVDSFSFDFKGLAGWAMDLMDVSTHADYSIISLGTSIPGAAREPNSATVRFTQAIFFFITVFVPFLHIVALNLVWLVPMTRKLQDFFYQACEVMYAWSCMDVFVVSIMAAVLEIAQFALFMVGDRCDFLAPILDKYFADILGDYNSCFEVIAVLDDGCWILFSAVIFYTIVTNVYMRICREALASRALQGRASTPAASLDINNSTPQPVIEPIPDPRL